MACGVDTYKNLNVDLRQQTPTQDITLSEQSNRHLPSGLSVAETVKLSGPCFHCHTNSTIKDSNFSDTALLNRTTIKIHR